jgi:hypothetical protein
MKRCWKIGMSKKKDPPKLGQLKESEFKRTTSVIMAWQFCRFAMLVHGLCKQIHTHACRYVCIYSSYSPSRENKQKFV